MGKKPTKGKVRTEAAASGVVRGEWIPNAITPPPRLQRTGWPVQPERLAFYFLQLFIAGMRREQQTSLLEDFYRNSPTVHAQFPDGYKFVSLALAAADAEKARMVARGVKITPRVD